MTGKRNTGTGERWFAIAGPGWQGKLPERTQRIDAPPNMVWLPGRTQTNACRHPGAELKDAAGRNKLLARLNATATLRNYVELNAQLVFYFHCPAAGTYRLYSKFSLPDLGLADIGISLLRNTYCDGLSQTVQR